MQRRHLVGIVLGAALLCSGVRAAEVPDVVVVFAAASLANVLQEISVEYTKATGVPVKLSFAASSALARQIESGAAADLFISADQQWMEYLDQRGLIQAGTRHNLLGNRLALVAPAGSAIRLKIEPKFPLLAALKGERLATGDPDSVPVGRYARAALTRLGVWDDVVGRLVPTENVRAALAFVARGEVPLAIVYETDARVEKKVRIVDLFPPDSHPPIAYPVALTKGAGPRAGSFLEYLRGPAARARFEKDGFTVLH